MIHLEIDSFYTLTRIDEGVEFLRDTVMECELDHCQFGRRIFTGLVVLVEEIAVHQIDGQLEKIYEEKVNECRWW